MEYIIIVPVVLVVVFCTYVVGFNKGRQHEIEKDPVKQLADLKSKRAQAAAKHDAILRNCQASRSIYPSEREDLTKLAGKVASYDAMIEALEP